MSKNSSMIKKLLGLSTTMPLGSAGGPLTGAHLHSHSHGAGCGCSHSHDDEEDEEDENMDVDTGHAPEDKQS